MHVWSYRGQRRSSRRTATLWDELSNSIIIAHAHPPPAHTHTQTQLSLICPWTFVQCRINFHPHIEYSLWISPMRCFHDLVSGCLYRKWATGRGNDRKRETARKMGRSSDSEPQNRKLGDLMHIHKAHFLSELWENVWIWKRKNTHTYIYIAELVKYTSCSVLVELWKRWVPYLIEYRALVPVFTGIMNP